MGPSDLYKRKFYNGKTASLKWVAPLGVGYSEASIHVPSQLCPWTISSPNSCLAGETGYIVTCTARCFMSHVCHGSRGWGTQMNTLEENNQVRDNSTALFASFYIVNIMVFFPNFKVSVLSDKIWNDEREFRFSNPHPALPAPSWRRRRCLGTLAVTVRSFKGLFQGFRFSIRHWNAWYYISRHLMNLRSAF